MGDASVLRFGSFRLDRARRVLLHDDAPVALGSRAFDLLVALVNRRGELGSKDELLAQVWPGRIVEENNLAAQMCALRKVLGDDPRVGECLRTIPGRGYCFVAPIEEVEQPTAVAGLKSDVGVSRRARAAEQRLVDPLSIAVLPLVSSGGGKRETCLMPRMSEAIATCLSRVPGLRITSLTSAAVGERAEGDIRRIVRSHRSRFLLRGSVQWSRRTARIIVQLVDAYTGDQQWSDIIDSDRTDLLTLQDLVTGRITTSIGREVFVVAARQAADPGIEPTSGDLVIRGIAADSRSQSLANLQEQERLFGRAVQLDPDNADALAWLARAILLQSAQAHAPVSHKREALVRGAEAAQRALALDPRNARAHLATSYLHALRGEFEHAVLASERSIALDRNLAMAHNMRATSLAHCGRGEEALAGASTALRLDPLGPQFDVFLTTRGIAQLLVGHVNDAIDSFTRARVANPQLVRAHLWAAIALAVRGERVAAQAAAEELLQRAPEFCLSETVDACRPSSPPRYRRFFEQVVRPAALSARVVI